LEPAEYEYMYKLEDAFWWYRGMRGISRVLLEKDLIDGMSGLRVLDAGAGTGGSLQMLQHYGDVTAFDFEPVAAEMYARREKGRIAVASIDGMPYADNTFDLVTSFDVLCQLEPDQETAALSEVRRVLKPAGGVLFRVPAFQFMFGPHDVAVHSRHRYSAGEMETKLAGVGLTPVATTYANTILFPVAMARRLVTKFVTKPTASDVRPVPGPVDALFGSVLRLEAAIIRRARLPFGLSVFALARKP
jgi:SAM-dependent methyltransferase